MIKLPHPNTKLKYETRLLKLQTMKKRLLYPILPFLSIFFIIPITAGGQTIEDFKREQFIAKDDTLNYRILYPRNFDRNKEYPLVLFLHGAGERGSNNESQLTHWSKLFLEKGEEFPAIVIFPQAANDDYWAKVEVERDSIPYKFNFKNEEVPTTALNLVMTLMTSVLTNDYIDKNRIYVGGLSMGGMGTFEIISRKPGMFAAAFAICGGADPGIVKNYPQGFNFWIFHGEKDNVVLPEYSKIMAREINSHGGNAKLSLYPNDNHNSWDSAFAEPHLLPWLFKHSKNNKL